MQLASVPKLLTCSAKSLTCFIRLILVRAASEPEHQQREKTPRQPGQGATKAPARPPRYLSRTLNVSASP